MKMKRPAGEGRRTLSSGSERGSSGCFSNLCTAQHWWLGPFGWVTLLPDKGKGTMVPDSASALGPQSATVKLALASHVFPAQPWEPTHLSFKLSLTLEGVQDGREVEHKH